MRPYRVYKGVKIFRNKILIPGSDLKERKRDGELVPCKGEYEVTFTFCGSYPYDTLEDVKEAIDNIRDACHWVTTKEDEQEWQEVMNS